MLKDLHHGLRMLLHARGWTAVVVLSLGLGIGANTALFGAINSLLIVKVDVAEPDTLVRLTWSGRNDMATSTNEYGFSGKDAAGVSLRSTFSYPMYQQLVADNRTMTNLLACAPFGTANVIVDGAAEIAEAFIASGNYFQMLGVNALVGRVFTPADDRPDASPAAVISVKYWHARFAGDPGVVGRVVRVNGLPVTIVGVLPVSFAGIQRATDEAPDISLPIAFDSHLRVGEPRLGDGTNWWVQIAGRLKPGASAAQVQGNLDGPFRSTSRTYLDGYLAKLSDSERATAVNRTRSEVPHLRVDSGSHGIYTVPDTQRQSVTILTVVSALVLLIVCANVANMLLSRATARRKELSLRLSLGATRGRLIRQLMTESLLLASLGGGLGVAIGYWGKQLLPGDAGRITPLDWRMLAFVGGITLVTGVLFGIAPALRATSMNVSDTLKENSRSVVGARSRLGRVLLIVQVAISLVLLVGAGLFLQTLQNLRRVDVGFDPQNLVLFRINPSANHYDMTRSLSLYDQMLERLAALPGVRAVSLSQPALLSGATNTSAIFVQGRTYAPDRHDPIHRLVISPNFFSTMGIPIVAGRAFTASDNGTAPKVVIVNEAAVRTYFPNHNPIGEHFGSSAETSGQLEIVGVLRDVKYNSVRDAVPPTMYVPFAQGRPGSPMFQIRMSGDSAATINRVREAVRQIDPTLPMTNVSTQIALVERRFADEKIFARAYTLFGGLALLLASVGLFGLMSYNVARRTNEIGIRMALGAQRGDVLRLVLGESMSLVLIGVVCGIAIAVAAGRLVTSLLFGLSPTDGLTMTAAVVVMLVVSATAGYLPARRASLVDPMVALHDE